jgi:hypothetical protein
MPDKQGGERDHNNVTEECMDPSAREDSEKRLEPDDGVEVITRGELVVNPELQ